MTAITDWVKENWRDIECTFYSSMGLGAYAAAFGSAFTPAAITAVGWTLIGGAFELTYALAGCNEGPLPPPPQSHDGCWKVDKTATVKIRTISETPTEIVAYDKPVQEIIRTEPWPTGDPPFMASRATLRLPDGSIDYAYSGAWLHESLEWFLVPIDDAVCIDDEPPTHEPGEPIGDPTVHEDGECIWTITPVDAYVDGSGVAHTYYVIEANNDACGGPFAYWSSDKGPDFVQPDPDNPTPNPDNPNPTPPPNNVNCPDPCKDYDEEFAQIMAKLQELKDCACNEKTKPPLEGTWISTHWRSDADSPNSNRPLRKLFRYRSKSTRTNDELQAYWADFVWTSGPVCVIHKGAWWGTPQVWASTEAEGQRVIRRAGAEAGLDPDQAGEWLTRSSHSPRYGMSRQMRLDTTPGERWVTRREGPSGFPEL